MKGYCWIHDREYSPKQDDDICPQCLLSKEQDLVWRGQEDNSNEE